MGKHSKHAKDVYDHDQDTASPYDDAPNVNGGNPYHTAISSDAPVEGPGIKETEAAIGKALKERKAKKDFDASGVPELPGEIVRKEAASDSATAFAGAIQPRRMAVSILMLRELRPSLLVRLSKRKKPKQRLLRRRKR